MEEKRVIEVGGEKHSLNIYIERRNSIRVSITRQGINIRIPRNLSSFEREKEIKNLTNWAIKKIKNTPSPKKKTYSQGDYLRTNSKIYQLDIQIRDSIKNFSKISGSMIIFKISKKHSEPVRQKYISKQLQKMLARNHHGELNSQVRKLNEAYFGKEIKKISYKYTSSRWGACKTKTKEINISTKLLFAPLKVLEYVIIHELTHLIQANHSKRFWNIVKSIDPSYKTKKKWLKEQGDTLKI